MIITIISKVKLCSLIFCDLKPATEPVSASLLWLLMSLSMLSYSVVTWLQENPNKGGPSMNKCNTIGSTMSKFGRFLVLVVGQTAGAILSGIVSGAVLS